MVLYEVKIITITWVLLSAKKQTVFQIVGQPEMGGGVIEGADIAGPIKASGVFPPILGYMIAVGEQSGELDSMMQQIGDSYQDEVEIATQKLTSLIEPILILVLAVMVGFIIMAILWPVLQMTSNF